MYKVIVVDDEPRVRRGLQSLIPQLDADWTVAATAASGVEAIELVRKEMPDLVITDIRMPRMNGLDLLSALREYPVQVVILSGYGYFEYAQTAVKFGAFDFLLKPVKPAEIKSLLQRAKERKRSNEPAPSVPSSPVNYSKWWKEWLSETEEGQDYGEKLKAQLPPGAACFRLMAIEIDRYDELIMDDQWGDKQLVLFAVRNVVHEALPALGATGSHFLFASGPQLYYLTYDCDCGSELSGKLLGEVRKWVKISISVGLSAKLESFESLPAGLGQAKEALRNKWIYGDGIVSSYDDVVSPGSEDRGYPTEIDESIVRAVRLGDAEQALIGLAEFVERIKAESVPFRLFRRFCLQLLSSVFRVVYEHKLNEMIRQRIDHPQDLFHRDFTAEEFIGFMGELIRSTVESMEWSVRQKQNRTIEKAVDFIRKNYAKDISLDDVAVHAQMSSSYLSTFFKQETGETFIEYLTRLRIDKAKTLMMNAQLRLYEIAQLVGYQDVKYFSRLFKRVVGVTPAEYRQFFYRKEE
ncbi:response regulator transcription factor [Paenibacillus arenilitoris]|uniref:Response regulator n=1 Tax=Paenibacillus arenilitoris TaxID=2772299 RepID=A0A927CIS5_9BACL|nr:response regulator [Paenibacillus arenilitoris]MBD2867398.1 response regulator [Paenibacillus arenilitoris]